MEEQSISLLDRVISSKKTAEIEQFQPLETIAALLKHLPYREEDVLRRRYGLSASEPETLEGIGKLYGVTRERIRQVESSAILKLRGLKSFRELVKPVQDTIASVLEQHGGVMREESLFAHVLQIAGNTEQNRRAVHFMLSELLKDVFQKIKPTRELRGSWKLTAAPLHLLNMSLERLIDIIRHAGKPALFHDLYEHVSKDPFFQEHASQLTEDAVASYIEISQHIDKNPYQEYGLIEWGNIAPKRMDDKIYLVLKKHGKPMHFTKIAEMINQMHFDERKAYPPTVHNELILSEKYVLIGRGIYALKEWGYTPGIVADVLVRTLKAAGKPLSRNDLVEAVLKQRIVKKNTIYLALTDKKAFHRMSDGTYTLAE
ncbi:MAG: hypothetical protein A2898_04120 [Candidatus Kerfeldbacteria bacterium RIFCSPLOWO2_01_FULL_48_11]|uniref:HTH HARE-type domain-containing protein n=1 Tax=Candidatus Kerfeldbacteria bacterium RIFCSPLOWO2_01_FULL_48_11 TaxID=1798543 RepID=A0A1G2B1B0_9BACT|nr:MAG: RNA polymerase alpha chain family protein,sigma-70 family protein [Parcubacteria group bacterium GW2011_GWA2_48_9]KKW16336.1 MAG: RNA polymerase alpha chain family protein,sigma-70 family protein [Parcubacteria group bacterium GW2011_GWC2_49_9]OGY82755.1 MAG: hypothetical protein A2898_04120 [Candidatus Kerfeldbacteria bacterium RIFCSPLOWO2_01_FULL_48_11]HCJ52634.1 hypothetical protein [Candidatus Kerfeldbacteria bacterium]